jgi:hypothetical protein
MFNSPDGGFDVQLIASMLESIPADVAGLMAVILGLAAFATLIRLDQTRKDRRNGRMPERAASEPEPVSDWRRSVNASLAELERVPDLRSMQSDAALQIDAAEHAFNRMVAECTKVSNPQVAPTFAPSHELPSEQEKPADKRQQPLAA